MNRSIKRSMLHTNDLMPDKIIVHCFTEIFFIKIDINCIEKDIFISKTKLQIEMKLNIYLVTI